MVGDVDVEGLLGADLLLVAVGDDLTYFPWESTGVTLAIADVTIYDGAASLLDAGVLAVGHLWQTERSIAYGIDEGRLMLDRRDPLKERIFTDW